MRWLPSIDAISDLLSLSAVLKDSPEELAAAAAAAPEVGPLDQAYGHHRSILC